MSFRPARVTRDEAGAFVAKHHRHLEPALGDRFCLGCWHVERAELVGVAVVGRPTARGIDQAAVVEVTRCATDGTRNACSWLYQRSADVARCLGFRAVITYTRGGESGSSLRALGWWSHVLEAKEHSWQSRVGRAAGEPIAATRWLCLLNDFEVAPAVSAPKTQMEIAL